MCRIKEISLSVCIIVLLHTSLEEKHTQISPPPQSNKINTCCKAGADRKERGGNLGSLWGLRWIRTGGCLPSCSTGPFSEMRNKENRVVSKHRYVLPKLSANHCNLFLNGYCCSWGEWKLELEAWTPGGSILAINNSYLIALWRWKEILCIQCRELKKSTIATIIIIISVREEKQPRSGSKQGVEPWPHSVVRQSHPG